MTEKEALKLALEALENSVDLVVEDAYNAEQLYGNYPTRQGKVGGLKVLAEQHKQAITAIKEALAQPAAQAERKPLSDEEIYSLADSLEIWNEDDEEWILDPNTFARAIEAAHGIGGEDQ